MKLSYPERLRAYERDKRELLRTAAHLPAQDIYQAVLAVNDFEKRLKELKKKWRI